MRYKEIISEMPVAGIEKNLPDTDNFSHFQKKERNTIKQDTYDPWVKRKLHLVPFDLFIYIVDTETSKNTVEPYCSDTKHSKLPFLSGFFDLDSYETNEYLQMLDIPNLKQNFDKNPGAVHMLIAHNDPEAAGWIMLTPYMILHRLAHACLDTIEESKNKDSKIVKKIYDLFYQGAKYGIMKYLNVKSTSKKTGDTEVLLDCFCSYLMNGGNISFKMIPPKEDDYLENMSQKNAEKFRVKLNSLFKELCDELKGRVWIG